MPVIIKVISSISVIVIIIIIIILVVVVVVVIIVSVIFNDSSLFTSGVSVHKMYESYETNHGISIKIQRTMTHGCKPPKQQHLVQTEELLLQIAGEARQFAVEVEAASGRLRSALNKSPRGTSNVEFIGCL